MKIIRKLRCYLGCHEDEIIEQKQSGLLPSGKKYLVLPPSGKIYGCIHCHKLRIVLAPPVMCRCEAVGDLRVRQNQEDDKPVDDK